MTQTVDEFNRALEIETRTFKAVNDAITEIVAVEEGNFPNHPLMVPTLCLAAMCQYLNSYIESFPENMRPSIITMAYQTIGFAALEQLHNLATMEVAGHA